MANEAGVVKSVTGGGVRALNNITGEVRNLNAGDIVYQNEKITTDSSNSKVVITQTDGKDITLLGKDTITLDQSTSNNESFGNETVADISALQQAILNGTDLNALEETAAGGGAAGGGDGVSLSAASFTEGGHSSNVNADVGNIDSILAAGARGNDLSIGQGDNANVNAAPTPSLPAGSIKIPLSAYKGESVSSALLDSFASSIPNGYHVHRHTDGRDYLTPNDPTAPSAFQHKDGWYVSKDGNLAIGQDNAKDLAVTSAAKASNYLDDGSVAKIVNPNPSLKVFGSDNADKITVDGTRITSVHGGVGNDNVDLKNGAETVEIFGGSGNDGITVNNSTVSGRAIKNDEGKIIRYEAIKGGDGVDTISIQNESKVRGNIYGNAGKDNISLDGGAKVYGAIYGDSKTMNDIYEKQVNPALDIVDKGADADTITVSGAGTGAKHIFAGDGDDKIVVKDGAKVTGEVRGDEGGDKITVSGDQTYVSGINGRGGDDKIFVEKGAKVDGIVGRWGNDNITVTGKDTTVKEYIHGDDGDDTINVLDGATIGGNVEGNNGADTINIEKSTIKGKIQGDAGNDTIKASDSMIEKNEIRGGEGDDTIIIGAGNRASAGIHNGNLAINGDAGNDTVILKDGITGDGLWTTSESRVSITNNDGNIVITKIDKSDTVDLSKLAAAVDNDLKSVDITSVNGGKLNITAKDILDINKTTGSILTIKGGNDDAIHKTDGSTWQNNGDGTYSATVTDNQTTHTVTIKVEDSITPDL